MPATADEIRADMNTLKAMITSWLRGDLPPPLTPGAFALAQAHGLAGMVYHIHPQMPEKVAQAAAQAWHRQCAAYMLRQHLLSAHWPTWAPPPMIIKGADLAEALYNDPGVRHSVDLDLLLPDPAFEPVCAHLSAAADAHRDPTTLLGGALPHERGFVFHRPSGDLVIELHRDPQPRRRAPLRGADLWLRGQPADLDGLAIRQPTDLDRLLLWLTDQVNDGFLDRLRDYVDLALILRRLPSPEALTPHIHAAGLTLAWRLAYARLSALGWAPQTHAPPPLTWQLPGLPPPDRPDPYAGEPRTAQRRLLKLLLWSSTLRP